MSASITTRTGDKGKTSIFGGKRVSKASERIHAAGDIDELNAILGVILAEGKIRSDLRNQLIEIQKSLVILGTDISTPLKGPKVLRVNSKMVDLIEEWSEDLEKILPPLNQFILPTGFLHQARAVCRRAERWAVALSEKEKINKQALIYLNRLSDYLFLAARTVNGS